MNQRLFRLLTIPTLLASSAATISEILSTRQVALGASVEAPRTPNTEEPQQLLSKIASFFGIKTR